MPVQNLPAEPRPTARKKPRRVLYALGAGDAVAHLRQHLAGVEPPFMMSIAFSEQVFCALPQDWRLDLLSSNARRDLLLHGPHRIENLPASPLCFRSGFRYHLGRALYGLRLVGRAVRRRAAVVIADSGTTHWCVLAPLRLFRIPVVAVLHNAPWPPGYPPTRRLQRILLWLDGWFFRHVAAATVCVSPECEQQVRQLAGRLHGPALQCRAQYRDGFLTTLPAADPAQKPFCVLFLGRLEEYKGVFLLLDVAERLERERPGGFAWKIYGEGPATEQLAAQIAARNLRQVVQLSGRLAGEAQAHEAMAWAHVVLVPTTSAFAEGMPQSAAEGVLAGRPVVASQVVPVAGVLGRAAVLFRTGDAEDCQTTLWRLATDAAAYEAARQATLAVRAQFHDRSRSLGAVLKQLLSTL